MKSIAQRSPGIVTGFEEGRQAASARNLNKHDHFGTDYLPENGNCWTARLAVRHLIDDAPG